MADITDNYQFTLPSPSNTLDFDVLRLISAITAIDAQIKARATETSQLGSLVGGQINGINGQINGINGQISTMGGQISALNGNFSSLDAALASLSSTLAGQISSLDSEKVSRISVLPNNQNMNNLVQSGLYGLKVGCVNGPPVSCNYAQVLVISAGQNDTVAQLVSPYDSKAFWVRSGVDSTTAAKRLSKSGWVRVGPAASTAINYDGSGRVSSINEDGQSSTIHYNTNGTVQKITTPVGASITRTTALSYSSGRLSSVTVSEV